MSEAETLDPAIPACLTEPDAYPLDASASQGVSEVQTHLSHVFLTRDRVYKLKKSVDVGFASFLTRAERNEDCLRELRLNRRLAPDVYLGISPIEERDRGFAVGAVDANPKALGEREHCVVMRRLPAGLDASTLIDTGALRPERIDRVADHIASFHERQRLGTPSPFTTDEWLAQIWRPVAANFESLEIHGRPPLTPEAIASLHRRSRESFERLKPDFERRRSEGRAVDGHGDLHLEHVWFEADDGEPVIIDCLEFDDALRQVDAASEVAFLAMDLGFRGHQGLGERWLAHYAAAADDFGLYAVVDFFISYRAAVRGKVEAIAAQDQRIPEAQRRRSAELARDRVAFATNALSPRGPGRVLLVGGLIGTGKSSVARELAEAVQGVVIASDRVRERDEVARSQPDAGGDWQRGRYAPAARGRIYDEVLRRATPVVSSGRTVILDASWSSGERREQARSWADELGSASHFVEVRCGREETLARLEKRKSEGLDPSEAGPEIYDAFAASYDSIREDEWRPANRWTVHTDRSGWRDTLRERAQENPDV